MAKQTLANNSTHGVIRTQINDMFTENYASIAVADAHLADNASHGLGKVGLFSRDVSLASGNQSIAGLGFKPRSIIFMAAINGVTWMESIGFNDGIIAIRKINTGNVAANQFYVLSDYSIEFHSNDTNKVHAKIVTFDLDGFTLAWVKTGTITGTASIAYFAIK